MVMCGCIQSAVHTVGFHNCVDLPGPCSLAADRPYPIHGRVAWSTSRLQLGGSRRGVLACLVSSLRCQCHFLGAKKQADLNLLSRLRSRICSSEGLCQEDGAGKLLALDRNGYGP